jgi:23S rRNA pseudouridine2605 synthase
MPLAPPPKSTKYTMTTERLQKFLSRAGVASRRAAEEMIQAGRVAINGEVVTAMGVKVDPNRDRVEVDGRAVRAVTATRTVMLHKPYGYVCTTRDPQGRRVVTELLGRMPERLYPVGRLDYDATGLLLLTNDGELAYRLTHPSYQVPRTYRVTLAGEVSKETVRQLSAGVELEGRGVYPEVSVIKREADKTVLEITVHEGRYHLIKRLMDQVGHPVLKLKRIALGPLRLEGLPRGTYREVTGRELAALKAGVDLQ